MVDAIPIPASTNALELSSIAACVSDQWSPQIGERWPREFGQFNRWIFCLTAAKDLAANQEQRMTKRSRRTHSPAFKAKVALAAIKSEKTLSELAQQFDVHANQITTWRSQLLEGAAGVFGHDKVGSAEAAPIDLKSLHAKIGSLALENDFLSGALSKAGLLSAKR
jgi:transposase-like protein